MLFIEGLPIFFLELAIGQRLRKGSIGAWNRVSSYLGGIGIASGVVSFNVALYYNTIIAWCLFYFGTVNLIIFIVCLLWMFFCLLKQIFFGQTLIQNVFTGVV
jgi:hypothetical protein